MKRLREENRRLKYFEILPFEREAMKLTPTERIPTDEEFISSKVFDKEAWLWLDSVLRYFGYVRRHVMAWEHPATPRADSVRLVLIDSQKIVLQWRMIPEIDVLLRGGKNAKWLQGLQLLQGQNKAAQWWKEKQWRGRKKKEESVWVTKTEHANDYFSSKHGLKEIGQNAQKVAHRRDFDSPLMQ